MWVRICNLNHIPKIGATESCSCWRRDLFRNFALKSVCASAASNRWVIIHSEWLFSCQGKGGKKNPLCFIHFVVCLARFMFAKSLSCEIPSDVFSYTAVTKESWGAFGLFSRRSFQFSEEWVILLCSWKVAFFREKWIKTRAENSIWLKCWTGFPVLAFISYHAWPFKNTASQ